MKNLIINIFKTLFFFDLAVIIISLLPEVTASNEALLKLKQEALILIVPFVLTLIYYLFIEKRKIGPTFGKRKFHSLFLGIGIGILPIAICVGALKLLKGIDFAGINKPQYIWYWLAALLCNAIASELLYRGYLFSLYKKHYGLIFATVVTTLFYISFNTDLLNKPKIYIANITLFNILLCLLLEHSGSVITTIAARFTYSSISCILFGSLYSNTGYPTFLKVTFSGKALITGGEYRIEGSVIMLCITALALSIILIRKYELINLLVSTVKQLKIKFSYRKPKKN